MSVGERRQYNGAAASTTLNGAVGAGDTTITLTDATGWPDGSVGPFFGVVDPGLAGEEKIKFISRTGNSLTVVTTPATGRGADGTIATTHVSGAQVEHVWTADDADKLNAHINDLNDNHPSLLNTTRHDTTARHAAGTVIGVGTPGASAVGDSAAQGVSTNLARADHVHGRESFGSSAVNSNPGDIAATGSGTTPARWDHKHGREVFGTAITDVGTTTSAGSSTPNVPRVDHQHSAPQHTRLTGRAASLFGGTPPAAATGPWLMQAGYTSVTTDGSGNFTLTLPTAFPNGVLSVTTSNVSVGYVHVLSSTASAVSCKATAADAGGHIIALVSTTISVPWIAVGW